jgi:SAM-dependent methyltransferase
VLGVAVDEISTDMTPTGRRPFYSEYAWAFDLIIDRPVRKECAVLASWLVERNVLPGAEILDAGCGTGRYAIELARRGYRVDGIDVSPELVAVAKQTVAESPGSVLFRVGDILDVPDERYHAILCRGVLNDIVDDGERDAVFASFAQALRPGGVLIVDVRDWGASVERKSREPVFRKRVSTDRGELTFTAVTTLDLDRRQLLIFESHALVANGLEHVSDYQFVMRCWEREELEVMLARHGFGTVRCFGAYDVNVEAGATDRIVTVAQLC